MTTAKTINVGGFNLPLSDGAIKDLSESLHDITLEPIVFTFEYRQIKFRCTCDDDEQGKAKLGLFAKLGRIPFTAETPYGRMAALTIAKAANRDLKGIIGVNDGAIILNDIKTIPTPVTATGLISAIVVAIGSVMPYVSLLFEIIGPPLPKTALPPLPHPKV